MKAYVLGYRTVEDEAEVQEGADRRVVVTPKLPRLDVAYTREPEWVMTSRYEADAECQILRRHWITVGPHRCDFSVEELPTGEFAVVCAKHQDAAN